MSDKSPLQSFIAAHPRFHLAILLGEVGVSGAVQAAARGDVISLAVLQAVDLYLKECEQHPEEPVICVACDMDD
jgi:Ni,Fe-hydrogenase III small subunit